MGSRSLSLRFNSFLYKVLKYKTVLAVLLSSVQCFSVADMLSRYIMKDTVQLFLWGSKVCGKIYKDASPLQREKWVPGRSVSLRAPINPQHA